MINVLVVDDEPGMLETLTDVLTELGHKIDTAENGKKAIELIKNKPYDLIFMDIKMPGKNGVETFKRIKEIRPNTIVIMMTAYSVEDLIKEAVDEGAYGVIYKPFDMSKTIDYIEEIEKGICVMVVDDDYNTCETLFDIFQEKGYRTIVSLNEIESLELVKKKDPDIVFIDYKMPILNGLELFVKAKEIKPDIKAVLMTGYHNEVKIALEKRSFTNNIPIIYKPFNLEHVLDVINQVAIEKME